MQGSGIQVAANLDLVQARNINTILQMTAMDSLLNCANAVKVFMLKFSTTFCFKFCVNHAWFWSHDNFCIYWISKMYSGPCQTQTTKIEIFQKWLTSERRELFLRKAPS